jgi:hypothetical protein
MRVVLRNPHASDGRDFRYSLTVGRVYEVLGIPGDSYHLLNDRNEPIYYDRCCFEIVDATDPDFWQIEYGEDGLPEHARTPEWSQRGYFERWHDGDQQVIDGFWRDLERLYPYTAEERRTR